MNEHDPQREEFAARLSRLAPAASTIQIEAMYYQMGYRAAQAIASRQRRRMQAVLSAAAVLFMVISFQVGRSWPLEKTATNTLAAGPVTEPETKIDQAVVQPTRVPDVVPQTPMADELAIAGGPATPQWTRWLWDVVGVPPVSRSGSRREVNAVGLIGRQSFHNEYATSMAPKTLSKSSDDSSGFESTSITTRPLGPDAVRDLMNPST